MHQIDKERTGGNAQPTGAARMLLTAAQAARDVYGVSERTFHEMRKRGLVPEAVVLGPRTFRWLRSECEQAAANLPRLGSQTAELPSHLRRRIDSLKSGGSNAR